MHIKSCKDFLHGFTYLTKFTLCSWILKTKKKVKRFSGVVPQGWSVVLTISQSLPHCCGWCRPVHHENSGSGKKCGHCLRQYELVAYYKVSSLVNLRMLKWHGPRISLTTKGGWHMWDITHLPDQQVQKHDQCYENQHNFVLCCKASHTQQVLWLSCELL